MLKALFFCLALAFGGFSARAQASGSLPFIKLSHLGPSDKPIIDLFIAPAEPPLSPALGIDAHYKFESVCLLSEAEFQPLLRYAEAYFAQHKPDSRRAAYGTFALTLGPTPSRAVYARAKSLAFLRGAIALLQQQAAADDDSEALRRLLATAHRLEKN